MTLGLTGANRAIDVSSSLKILFDTTAECEFFHNHPNKSAQPRHDLRANASRLSQFKTGAYFFRILLWQKPTLLRALSQQPSYTSAPHTLNSLA
jgi:hypothetical protein